RQEFVDVGDPVLEQVTDLGRTISQQVGGIAAHHVLGQQQHRHLRVLTANAHPRLDALLGVGGWHANVHQAQLHVRVGSHRGQQCLGITDLIEDLHTFVLQQPCHTAAQQHRVLGDDHARAGGFLRVPVDVGHVVHGHAFHGMCAVRTVPLPGGLCTVRDPSTASKRSHSPYRPVPTSGSAPPHPSSVTVSCNRPSVPCSGCGRCSATRSTRVARACLVTLVSASHTT